MNEERLRDIIREELLKEAGSPTVVNTPRYDIKVYSSSGNINMTVTDSKASEPSAEIVLGKRGAQKLMDALTYHL